MSDDSSDSVRINKQRGRKGFLRMRTVRALLVCLWVLMGFIVAQIIGYGVIWAFLPQDPTVSIVVITVIASAAVYTLALGLVVGNMYYLRRWTRKKLKKRLGIQRSPTFKDFGLAFLGYIPYIFTTILVTAVITLVIPGFNPEEAQELGFDRLTGNLEFIAAFVALVILAPIAEELLFRGYLFGTLRGMMTFWPATILVSALFGLVHGQWNVALDTFILSVVMCWLREYTKAVWASIFVHMLKNGLAFTLLFVI